MAKYKLLVVALAAIIITALIQPTLAFYTTVGTATNVVTSGDIQLIIHETTASGAPFPSEGIIILPGSVVSKRVTIENVCNHPFFLRVKLIDGIDKTELSSEDCFSLNIDTENWYFRDGFYYYKHVVEPYTTTTPVFTEVEIVGDKVDNSYIGSTLTLTVNAYAVQSEFNSAEFPWEAEGWPQE